MSNMPERGITVSSVSSSASRMIFLFALVLSASASSLPNVVFLWVDDVGYGDLGFNGNTTMRTPHLDALAASGAILTQHLVASPICTPSRAALLTGRHAVRSGMTSGDPNFYVMGLGPGGLPENEITLAEALRDRGYSTAMVGKYAPHASGPFHIVSNHASLRIRVGRWHLGGTANESGLPTRHGFGSYWGMPITNVQACRAGHKEYPQPTLAHFLMNRSPTGRIILALGVVGLTPWLIGAYLRWRLLAGLLCGGVAFYIYWFTATLTLLNPAACLLYEGERVVEQPAQLGYMTLRHTRRATNFVRDAPQPFFLYLSYPNAHTALFAMDENVGASAHGAYGDNVEELDWSIGQLLGALESRGVRNETLIYFASDNGPFREELHEGGMCGASPILMADTPRIGAAALTPARDFALPLRGGKGQTWECGLRVPALISYPARWAAGQAVHEATTSMDLMPTLLSLVDGGPPRLVGRIGGGGDGAPFRHVSQLRVGELAGVGVLDGKSLVGLLDLAKSDESPNGSGSAGVVGATVATLGQLDRKQTTSGASTGVAVHDFIFHYCGDRIAAVRHGRWKAHYTTAKWEEPLDAQICRQNVICSCHGHEHSPPLLFDVHADPSESTALTMRSVEFGSERRQALERIDAAKVRHEASLVRAPSQTIRLPTPFSLPCCGVERGSLEHAWKVLINSCGC